MILTWLKAQAATLAAGALLLLSIGLFVAVLGAKGETRKQVKRADKAEASVVVVKADLATCQGNLLAARETMEFQSAQALLFKHQADAAQERSRKAQEAARKANGPLVEEVSNSLNRLPLSSDYAGRCREAVDYLRGSFR